jgi:uncharacterized protein (DUF58 family)
MTSDKQLTALFPNRVLQRLERLRIQGRTRRTNRGRGEHLAAKGGNSTEFCDYRDYAPGDDTRFVDWNLFARLRRPYLKQFHREEERHIVVLVDASQSMEPEGKFQLACRLAAAFGIMALHNQEPITTFVSNTGESLGPCRGRASLSRLLTFLEQLKAGGDHPVEAAIETVLRRHRGRGIAVVLSDFLTFADLTRSFNSIHAAGLDVFGVQILGPSEVTPPVSGDMRLLDSETEDSLDVSGIAGLVELYQSYRTAYEATLNESCTRRAGRFVSVQADAELEWVLFDLFRRQGWVV